MEFKLQLASRTLKRELLKSAKLQLRRGWSKIHSLPIRRESCILASDQLQTTLALN